MILDAISEALAAGTTEQVHGVAVLQREIWERRTGALETLFPTEALSRKDRVKRSPHPHRSDAAVP